MQLILFAPIAAMKNDLITTHPIQSTPPMQLKINEWSRFLIFNPNLILTDIMNVVPIEWRSNKSILWSSKGFTKIFLYLIQREIM